ncbi:MAG TPA: hypothetical protein VEJ84_18565 [Acidimicrobiales bacterium]|nr:hypothetical protein [Acidimicrobiales bacterium]
MAAETSMTVLRLAMQRWANGDDERDLTAIVRGSVSDLRTLAASG